MRAVRVERWQEPSELRVTEVPDPTPGPDEALVEVHAAACNFYDTLIVRGRYQVRPERPFTPGGELAGVVLETGDPGGPFEVGDRVFGFSLTGAYAERIALPVGALHRVPPGVSLEKTSALPIAYGTSYAALVQRAQLQKGETVLVHAAAGGVGLAAVQIARAQGAHVIATAGSPAKREIALAAGAGHALDSRSEDWGERVLDLTQGRGADVIYDSVGGEVFDRSLRCIAWNGRLLVVGFSSGQIPEVRINRVLLKNVSLVGVHWSAYPERDPDALAATYQGLGELLARGEIDPVISARYPLERLPEALDDLASGRSHGKILITPQTP